MGRDDNVCGNGLPSNSIQQTEQHLPMQLMLLRLLYDVHAFMCVQERIGIPQTCHYAHLPPLHTLTHLYCRIEQQVLSPIFVPVKGQCLVKQPVTDHFRTIPKITGQKN